MNTIEKNVLLRKDYEYLGINFRDTIYASSGLINIYENLNKTEFINYGDKKIGKIKGGTLVLEYEDEHKRNVDKGNFQELKTFSKKTQTPIYAGYFDNLGKYYIILDIEYKFVEDNNDGESIFQGVIVKPEKYMSGQSKYSEEIGNVLGEKSD